MRSYLLVTCTLMSVVSADSTCSFFECIDSDNAFRANSDSIFKSCQSLVEETSFVSVQKPSVTSNVEPSDTNDSLDQTLNKVLSDHAGSAIYNALQPKIKRVLWLEFRKLFSGTGMVALTPEGQELPVVSGSLRGLMDLILAKLGAGNALRGGVDIATRVTGFKDQIEAELKKRLGFSTLEAFLERMSQELTLKAFGYLSDGSFLKPSSKLTLSQIANIQQSVSLQDGRGEYLSGHAGKGEVGFFVGYVWYEMKNILNTVVAKAINNHLDSAQKTAVQEVKKYADSFVFGSAGALAIQGPAGLMAALGSVALYQKCGKDLIEFAYQAADHQIIDGMIGLQDVAAFRLSKEEIQTYHPVSVEIKTTEGDFVVVESVKEESYRVNILTGAVKNGFGTAFSTAAKVVGKGANIAVSTVRKIGSWFGY